MPKAFTKTQLLADIQQERNSLEQYLATLPPDLMIQPDVVGNWSVKDVLAHLLAWEQLVWGWYQAELEGQIPALPAAGYKWNQLPALNQWIYEQYRARSLADILTQFHASYQQILQLAQTLSEEELFTPGYYPWANKNPFASYLNSCTVSHYRWARREIRKGLRRQASLHQ